MITIQVHPHMIFSTSNMVILSVLSTLTMIMKEIWGIEKIHQNDCEGDLGDRKSTSDCSFLLSSGAISWSSKKQPIVELFYGPQRSNP